MAIKLSVAVRNAKLNAIESVAGASAVMKIRSGVVPASAADADAGSVLSTVQLPADWMADAANGVKNMSGVWQDLLADAAGVASYFRIYDTTGAVCHIQGTCMLAGAGGDMTLDNVVFSFGQPFTVQTFSLTEGNA